MLKYYPISFSIKEVNYILLGWEIEFLGQNYHELYKHFLMLKSLVQMIYKFYNMIIGKLNHVTLKYLSGNKWYHKK
jgi:hypothetical protein